MNGVFIPLSLDGECQQKELSAALGQTELLSQLTEECGELIQAAQKLRRVLVGTTPVSRDKALQDLTEEASDVVLILDMLAGMKLLDRAGVRFIGRYKTDRWYARIVLKRDIQKAASPTTSASTPLTREDLRDIYDGDDGPIWVAFGVVTVPAILDRYDDELIAVWNALGKDDALHEGDYGTTWLAYRNRPEG